MYVEQDQNFQVHISLNRRILDFDIQRFCFQNRVAKIQFLYVKTTVHCLFLTILTPANVSILFQRDILKHHLLFVAPVKAFFSSIMFVHHVIEFFTSITAFATLIAHEQPRTSSNRQFICTYWIIKSVENCTYGLDIHSVCFTL